MKTRKTVSKRIKLTKSGKIIKRKNGQGHFNSRESSKVTRNKRSDLAVATNYTRSLKSFMPQR